jgi:N-acetyl-gamma-glutamylphosphate reductase
MEIKAIIYGATGMIGQGVLIECLEHPDVKSILIIGRRSGKKKHKKWKFLFPKYVTTTEEVGQAMINAILYGSEKQTLESEDIIQLAKR